QGDVAGDCAQSQAEAVEGGGGEAVLAGHRSRPQLLFVAEGHRTVLDRRQSLVDVAEAHSGGDALDRYAAVALAELGEDPVLEAVDRREIDMAALGLDDMIMAAAAQQLGNPQACAGADDGDHPFAGKPALGAAEVGEMLVAELRD